MTRRSIMAFVYDSDTNTIREHIEDEEAQEITCKVKKVSVTPQGQTTIGFEVSPSTIAVLTVLVSLAQKKLAYKFHLTDDDKGLIRANFCDEADDDDTLGKSDTIPKVIIKALLSENSVLVILKQG